MYTGTCTYFSLVFINLTLCYILCKCDAKSGAAKSSRAAPSGPTLSLPLPQTHYLLYGSGFQTWEYSPTYGIRSYAYLLLHILPLLATNITY